MLMLAAAVLLCASDVSVEVEVKKPLKLGSKGQLRGELWVRIKNRGAQPVRLTHRDVHGFRFTPVAGGAPSFIVHPCDCAFEFGAARPPDNRTFTLEPQQEKLLKFDDFACDGSAHRAPAPGNYQLTFGLEPPSAPAALQGSDRPDLKECALKLQARPREAHESPAVSVRVGR